MTRTRSLYLSVLLAIGLGGALASAQTAPIRKLAPASDLAPARTEPSLEAQVAELRAQLDAIKRVLSVDANGNVILRADHDLVLKAGNVLEASAGNDAKLKSGRALELEAAQDVKLRGRNLRVDASGDLELLGRGRVSVRSDQKLDAEGKNGLTLRSSATMDARAALITLN